VPPGVKSIEPLIVRGENVGSARKAFEAPPVATEN
jgi:hypothetical protein